MSDSSTPLPATLSAIRRVFDSQGATALQLRRSTADQRIEKLRRLRDAVMLHKAKPQDLERSERLVLIGEADDQGNFHARDMLMKCPSKYNEENKVTGV